MRTRVRLFLGLMLIGFMGWAAASAEQATGEADTAAIYKKKCSMCHGVEGKGFKAIKTPDFTDAQWQASHKDEEIQDAIKNGKKGTSMQAFGEKLKEEEILALVAHIRSFNSEKKK